MGFLLQYQRPAAQHQGYLEVPGAVEAVAVEGQGAQIVSAARPAWEVEAVAEERRRVIVLRNATCAVALVAFAEASSVALGASASDLP